MKTNQSIKGWEVMMKGSVYAVLFTNGLFKVGYSSNVASRIRAHIGAGKSFGFELEMFFFTEAHSSPDRTEKNVLGYCTDRFAQNSPEYFEGGDYHSVREAMMQTKKMVAWGSGMTTRGDTILIPMSKTIGGEDYISSIKEYTSGLSARVLDVIKKNPGATTGVIKNRFRKQDITDILGDLKASEDVTVEVVKHPANGKEVLKYYAG